MLSRLTALSSVLFALLVAACDGPGHTDAGSVDAGTVDAGASDAGTTPDAGPPFMLVPPDELELPPGTAPVATPADVVFTTIPYGPHAQQVMDAFIHPDAATPSPVVIYIHGGGFIGGNRTEPYNGGTAAGLTYLLEQGVAYFSIDYRLLTLTTETEGVKKCLGDAQRALQFIRYYAEPLNIDPDRVALVGASAGAGTSLWLLFHDDLADPSGDVLAQQSTRVRTAVVAATQATYELFRWPPDVFSPTYPLTIDGLLMDTLNAIQVTTFYGVPFELSNDPQALQDALSTPEYVAYRQDCDMLALMSADDPPFFARNEAPNAAPGMAGFDLLHHPLHAQALATRASEVGLDAVVEAPALSLGGSESSSQFLLDALAP
ncbi:MAG: carboxylesterase family protein [Sandaracinaceae bacterium]